MINAISVNSTPSIHDLKVNIASREFRANPFPFYARLRAEAPVFRTTLPDKQSAWLITRYDDVAMVLKDEKRFVKNRKSVMSEDQLAKLPWVPGFLKPLEGNLLEVDGEEHTRLRNLIHKAFTPKLVEELRGRVQSLSDEIIDAAQRKGHMELVQEYALPIPLTIITELLGMKPQDRDRFRARSKVILAASAGNLVGALPNMYLILRQMRRIFREQRTVPQNGLITALMEAEENGDKLSENELTAMVFVLLLAGHETTVNLIASGTLALLEHPDQFVMLRNQPDLIKNAIEEIVRYTNPVEEATERYASEDVTLHGVTIPKGEMVLPVLASANRDEQYFSNPDKFDITRQNNKHFGFGQGVHYCVGAPLARLEGQIALMNLIERIPHLQLGKPANTLRWRAAMTVRGLEALPVTL